MRLAVSAAHGIIGSAVVEAAHAAGHDVTTITRRDNTRELGDVLFDPQTGWIEIERLEGLDAVVHLGGWTRVHEKRWTAAHRANLLSSRVERTTTLAAGLAALASPPAVVVSESWVFGYGDRGEEVLTDVSSLGHGHLAQVTQAWEAATGAMADAGIRTVLARYGSVMSPRSGLWAAQVRRARRGLGGRDGSGRQWMSWITPQDAAAATLHLVAATSVEGPVNVTAPTPARNAEVAQAIAAAVGRKARIAVPAPVWWAVLGGGALETVLASQRVVPEVLERTDFEWQHPTLVAAVAQLLGLRS